MKGNPRKTGVHDDRKSDEPIVPKKPANKGGAVAPLAESVEGRGSTKGKAGWRTNSQMNAEMLMSEGRTLTGEDLKGKVFGTPSEEGGQTRR